MTILFTELAALDGRKAAKRVQGLRPHFQFVFPILKQIFNTVTSSPRRLFDRKLDGDHARFYYFLEFSLRLPDIDLGVDDNAEEAYGLLDCL